MTGKPIARDLDTSTLLAAYGAALAVTVGSAVLLAGPLAAFLSGRGWAQRQRSIPETVLTSLVRGPAAAFDPAPPHWLFYLLTALLLLALYAGILQVLTLVNLSGNVGGAQWGGARVERMLKASEDPARRAGRITAGRGQHTKKIVAAEANLSATVFGMPGSSKTTGLVLPNAAEWRGPLVVTTTKAADLDVIYARRRALGPVWVIAPAGVSGLATHHWSPVDYCTDAKAADRMAAWMAEAASSSEDKRSAPWVDQAKSVLKGVLLAANLSGGGINATRRWLSLGKDAVDHVRAVLQQHGFDEVADDYASPWLRLHEDGIGSIQFSLNVLSRMFADEEIRATCAGTDFTVEDLLDNNGTICMIASPSDAERFAPLFSAIVATTIHGAETRYTNTGRPLDPALALMIDEAGNVLRYPRLPNILTTGRGMGIVMLTIWHDLSQLRERLGTQKANTVLSASGLRMLLPGCGDLETLKYFSGIYGRTVTMRDSYGHSRGEMTSNSSPTETDLAPVHYLQQMDKFTAIAQYSNRAPIKINMRLTFRDRDLKQLLAAPQPVPDTAPVHLDKTATRPEGSTP